jgi:hypothetical protein
MEVYDFYCYEQAPHNLNPGFAVVTLEMVNRNKFQFNTILLARLTKLSARVYLKTIR